MTKSVLRSKASTILAIGFSIVSSVAIGQRASTPPPAHKKVICTLTINSTEEKETFQKYLHPDYFEFVELLKDKNPENFFPKICQTTQTKCDVLLMSGHFAGKFFDDHHHNFELGGMEAASCGGCPNVLNGATQVYMFGCNTLASKSRDSRNPDIYYRSLRGHGFSDAVAREIVTLRYSPIGDSNTDRLRRIFRGSAVVAGFNTIAPKGEQVQPALSSYFAKLTPGLKQDGILEDWERRLISEAYSKELDRLKAGQTDGSNQATYDAGKRLNPLMRSMIGGNFTDVPGILPGSGRFDDFVATKLCSIKDNQSKYKAIEDIINAGKREGVLQILPSLLEISKHGEKLSDEDAAFFARLSNNTILKEILMGDKGIIAKLAAAPEEQMKTADLVASLGWIDQTQLAQIYHQAAVGVWNNSEDVEWNKPLFKRLKDEINSVNANEIKTSAFRGDAIWKMIKDRKHDQPDWAALAEKDLTVSINYYIHSYDAHALVVNNEKMPGDARKKEAKKMKEAREGADNVCAAAHSINGLRDRVSVLLTAQRAQLDAMSAHRCL